MTHHLLRAALRSCACLGLLALCATTRAQNVTFRDRLQFRAAAGSQTTQIETFDAFPSRGIVPSLFGGRLVCREPLPLVFFGNWGGITVFAGGGLIAGNAAREFSPGTPIVMEFPDPVFGIGANAFNDFGSVNVITLTVVTAAGNTFSVAEDSNAIGDTGFLGATSTEGIRQATWTINGNNYFELDLLELIGDLDRAVPVVQIATPPDGYVLGTATADVRGLATDGSAFRVTSTPAGIDQSFAAGTGEFQGLVPLLLEGENTIAVTATDAFGNVGGTSVTVVRDTTPPVAVVTSPSDGAVFGSASVTVHLDVVDATTTVCDIGPVRVVLPPGGASHAQELPLVPGANTIVIAVRDSGGNTTTQELHLVFDQATPTVEVLAPLPEARFGPGQATITVEARILDDTTCTIESSPTGLTGTVEPAEDARTVGTVALAEGRNAITVFATDAALHRGQGSVVVVLDTTPPAVTIDAPGAGPVRGVVQVEVRAVDATTAVAHVELQVDGIASAAVDADTLALAWDTASIADGPHTLTARAIDELGNAADAASVTVLVDNTPPVVTITQPLAGAIVAGTNLAFVVDALDVGAGLATLTMTVAGAPPTFDGSTAYPIAVPADARTSTVDTTLLADGPHVFAVTVTDAAGNQTTATIVAEVRNAGAIETAIVTPADHAILSGIAPIEVVADPATLASIEILVDGVSLGTAGYSPLRVDYDTTLQRDGKATIIARVTDIAGQATVLSRRVRIANLDLKLEPSNFELRTRRRGREDDVEAELRGAAIDAALPRPGDRYELQVPGANPIPAEPSSCVRGDGREHARDRLRMRFDRGAVEDALRAGIAAGLVPQRGFVQVHLRLVAADGNARVVAGTLVRIRDGRGDDR